MAEIFDSGECFRLSQPLRYGRLMLERLHSYGANIHIVTARGFSHRHRMETEEWLRENRFSYDRLAIVPAKEKADYATRYGLDIFIEDRLDTAVAMADVVRLSLLLDRPYNQRGDLPSPDNLKRFYSWEAIGHFFLGY